MVIRESKKHPKGSEAAPKVEAKPAARGRRRQGSREGGSEELGDRHETQVKNIKGNDQGELEVKFEMIADGRGTQAVHDTVVAYKPRNAAGTACTKNVGEVAGTNKKPWRKKGTGRARAGSFHSPLWGGGGVVFGPKPRDYSKKVGKSVRRLAFRKALSERINAGDVLTVDEFVVSELKTKAFVDLLRKQTDARRVLIVSDSFDEKTYKSARNVKPVKLSTAADVNAEQLLAFQKILVTQKALEKLAERTQ